jgi:hypothetical protein
MRRRTLLVVIAGLAVVATGAWLLWPRPERITQENCDRIRIGMSRAEVEAILGPPGDYRTGRGEMDYGESEVIGWDPDPPFGLDDALAWSRILCQFPKDPRRWANWSSDSFVIFIVIDESGQVIDKYIGPRRRTHGPIDDLLWRAKRRWHRRAAVWVNYFASGKRYRNTLKLFCTTCPSRR